MRRAVFVLFVLSALAAGQNTGSPDASATAENSLTHGPSHGSLLLLGGIKPNQAIRSTFQTLAGGPASHIVVIPTASVGDAGPPGLKNFLIRRFQEVFGVAKVSVLHSLDRATSDSDSFVEPLRSATGVWILGGFPENLVHYYLGTKTERAIQDLLDRGGVVGGESAGAMIQASWLDATGDGFTPEIRALMEANGRGAFGFLTGVAIFAHFDRSGDEAAVKFSAEYPDQLGIGIDEQTGLIVRGDIAQVIGEGTVSLYDGGRPSESPVVLRNGNRYDLRARMRRQMPGRRADVRYCLVCEGTVFRIYQKGALCSSRAPDGHRFREWGFSALANVGEMSTAVRAFRQVR